MQWRTHYAAQSPSTVVERNCRERFAEGEDGIKLYLQLLVWVRFANVREAVDEFEHRFVLYQCSIKKLFKERMREAGALRFGGIMADAPPPRCSTYVC